MAPNMTYAYKGWVGTESVTVTLKRDAGDLSRTAVTVMRYSDNRPGISFMGVQIQGDEVWFNIPVDQLTTGDEIQNGDRITDGNSNIYTVEAMGLKALESHYKCLCRKHI